jgi:peptidyl-prolyl cis-trans isomerase D
MSVLERLRKRSGLIVAIVGLALLAFVLTGLFQKDSDMFGGSDNVVGEIAGKNIEYREFNMKVQEAIENTKKNQGKTVLSQDETDQVVQQVWNQEINEQVMNKEYEKLGIAVSDEELYDLMVDHPHPALVRNLSDQQSGQVAPMFADEKTGQVSADKIRKFTQSMTDEQEKQWAQLEDYIKQVRIIEKYNNLIKKGLYVTTTAAKQEYAAQNRSVNIRYVVKNYKLVADSTIKPTDAELNTYYTAHQNEYKQEAARQIEYVTFDIAPSTEDMDEVKNEMQQVAEEFRTKKADEDSTFVITESNSRFVDETWHTPGTLSPQIDTAMFKAEVGTVMGPYEENGAYIVAKLTGAKTSADSAKVRHILIAYKGSGASETVTRDRAQAKKLADSLLGVLKKGGGKFPDFVEKYSDDRGKTMPPDKKPGEDYTGKGGNYGWLNASSRFVPEFKDAGLDNKKGDLVIAESQFGYHIMEVLDSKGQQKKVQVATIDRKVDPSSKTMQAVFVKASEFASKNTTGDLFQKAVREGNMNKRVSDDLKENDKNIKGLEGARSLVRWAYDNEKGAVSEPMEFGDKFVVATLTVVKEKGIAPLEQVKEDVTAKVIQEKKAEMFSKEFESAIAGGATTIDALAAKTKLAVEQAPNVNFNTTAIPGSNNEPKVMGAVSVMKAKTLSKPLAGKEGVFVVYAEEVKEPAPQKDYKAQQTAAMQQMQPRVDYEVYDALKESANVVEHLVKFPF